MKTNNPVLAILLITSFLLFSFGRSNAATFSPESQIQNRILYVKPIARSGDCFSWATACELQPALEIALDGDEIWVMEGTYKPTLVDDWSKSFELRDGVAIYGGFSGNETSRGERDWVENPTILSGEIGGSYRSDNSYHVVVSTGLDASAILDGFTITGGNAATGIETSYGGGMYNANSSPILTNIIFFDNSASSRGGGLYNSASNPTLTNVTFSSNSTYGYGGGIFNDASNPTLINVTFSHNTAVYGGGMFNWFNTSPSLSNVTFEGNTATNKGGGLHNHNSSSPTLINVTFLANSAPMGGGVYNSDSSSPTLTNVTFSGNTAGSGSGIYNYLTDSTTLTNVTFTLNSASICGAIYNETSNPTILNNAILWGNTPALVVCGGGFPEINFSIIEGYYPGTGNINEDPLLLPLADNGGFTQTHALEEGSPAIDTANPDPATCPSTDQRGVTRPIDGNGDGIARCDMGAYEYSSALFLFLPMILK